MTTTLIDTVERRLWSARAPSGRPESVLMVTPFAPYRDGISVYAQEELRRLRADGHRVEVLSPLPSAAHHHLPLGGARGAAMLAARAARYERVIVQVAPEHLFGRCRASAERALVWSALASMATRTSLDLRLHEVINEWLRDAPIERRAARLAIRAAARVTVHTDVEKHALIGEVGPVAERIEVIDHGAYFTARTEVSRPEAKRRLGLNVDEFALLCIGFLQYSKGFDRAVEAVTLARRTLAGPDTATAPPVHLHIVGTGRVDDPDIAAYTRELRALAERCPSVSLHERFVSDLEFDTWVAAADAVVVPYRHIWSSSVVERARLYEAPVISSDLPQLVDQIPDSGMACGSVEEMADAVVELVGRRQRGDDPIPVSPAGRPAVGVEDGSPWIVDQAHPDRNLIQKQIQLRAHAERDDTARQPPPQRAPSSRSPLVELSAMATVPRPHPTSARPGVSQVKGAVQRLTAWQVDPIVGHIEELQAVIVDSVLDLEGRIDATRPSDTRPEGAR